MPAVYTLKLGLQTTRSDGEELSKCFRIVWHMTNVMVKHSQNCLQQLNENHCYWYLLNKRYELSKQLKSSKNADAVQQEVEQINQRLNNIRMSCGLSKYQFYYYIHTQYEMYRQNIGSHITQAIADKVWSATEKVLFSNGKTVHFKKSYQVNSFEAKTNNACIRYSNGYVRMNDLCIPVVLKSNDKYAREALNAPIKYCRIVREWHKGKYKYYVQLVLGGVPPIKKYKNGKPKRTYGTQSVGIDIGTSTIAIVSDKEVILQEIGSGVSKIEKRIKQLNRKMERSRRATNPQNYNADGTIKSGRLEWKYSSNYLKDRGKRKDLFAVRKAQLNQSQDIIANKVVLLGTDVVVEDMAWQSLQKRSQETKVNEKTGRFQSKKRGGKTIANHAPSQLISKIEQRLNYIHKHLWKANCYKGKATKFNHSTCEYEEVKLSDRWTVMADGNHIQRDLHSAFNLKYLYEAEDGTYFYDIESMDKEYKHFKRMHDKCIRILRAEKQNGKWFPSCMGL